MFGISLTSFSYLNKNNVVYIVYVIEIVCEVCSVEVQSVCW